MQGLEIGGFAMAQSNLFGIIHLNVAPWTSRMAPSPLFDSQLRSIRSQTINRKRHFH